MSAEDGRTKYKKGKEEEEKGRRLVDVGRGMRAVLPSFLPFLETRARV